jgi:uncharacterized protein (DUF1800 family)
MARGNDLTAEQFFSTRGYDAINSNQYYFNASLADHMVWNQLLSGGNPVRKRVAFALSEFFVVSTSGVGNLTWRAQAMGEYWDVLNRHAFGNFRELLEDVTLNPAMGVWLNTLGNRKADPKKGRVPDENFGREVMQLFSIGLYELNIDGSLKTDSAGNPIETYDNDDVTGIAKAFTGYDLDMTGVSLSPNPSGSSWEIPSVRLVRQAMTADPSKWRYPKTESFHSDEEKSFLGTTIAAGTGAAETLRLTLDTLFNHPNVGPFFGKQMIQRLVTSNPSPGYVQRVAETFNDNDSGVRGDLAAVFKAVLLDDEALDPAGLADNRFGKVREPVLRVAQWARTFGANSASGAWEVRDLSDPARFLGQSPLRSPSVFNFFRPGYSPPGSQANANNMLAPEFQIVNETSVAGYVNTIERTISNGSWWMGDVAASYSEELSIAHDAAALLDRLDLLLTAGQLEQGTKDQIRSALDAEPVTQTSETDLKLRRIYIAVLLVMASNQYVIQK